MEKPLRCVLRLHKWTWYGLRADRHPGDHSTYRACRYCGKRRWVWGTAAADDFMQSGMDDATQKNNPSRIDVGF